MIKDVIIPRFVKQGITQNHLGFPTRLKVWGADTETVNGDPYTMQFHDGKTTDLIFVNRDNVLPKFLEYAYQNSLAGHTNVMYFHQLSFDLGVILAKYHKLWLGKSMLKLKYKDWYMDVCIGKVSFAFLKHKASNKQLKLLDSRAFFTNVGRTGLGALADQLKLPVKKMERPVNIGEKIYKEGKDKDYFIEYAKNDAVVEYYLAQWIIAQYREYDTRICVSAPQFASRVFRHYYFEKGDNIVLPPKHIIKASLLSYHGGKNGFYCKGITVVDKCYELDIVSAYPYAMTQLPNFLRGEYEYQNKYTEKYEGIWCVTGEYLGCKYPALNTHEFKPLQKGNVENLWVTSYELREALQHKEIKIKRIEGYVWISDFQSATHNPLSDYVRRFFEKKQKTPKSDNRYMLYKILLNSLYGKFVQTIDNKSLDADLEEFVADYIVQKDGKSIKNPEKEKEKWVAGGLFNPFIASLITGYVRAYLHRLEHKYQSLHSSTDSIKTKIKPVENFALGGITIQCYGKCYLFRNKLYLHYDEENKLKKIGLHGFQGRPEQLLSCFKNKKKAYKINHLFSVREAYIQGKKALAMQEVDRNVDLDFNKVRYI